MELVRVGDVEIPAHAAGALARYLLYKIPPGGFLSAVLDNDLFGAAAHADAMNAGYLADIVKVVYNYLPASVIRSEGVRDWLSNQDGDVMRAIRAKYCPVWEKHVDR